MTVNQIKRRLCLKKQCRHIRRFESHEFWEERRRRKQKKKDEQVRISYRFRKD